MITVLNCKNELLPQIIKTIVDSQAIEPSVYFEILDNGKYILFSSGPERVEEKIKEINLKLSTFCIKNAKQLPLYYETISHPSIHTVLRKTANKHCRVFGRAEPLLNSLVMNAEVFNNPKKMLINQCQWTEEKVDRIMSVDPNFNVLVNCNKKIECLEKNIKYIEGGFLSAIKEGILSGFSVRGIEYQLIDALLEYTRRTGIGGQIFMATRWMCLASELLGGPRLQEPFLVGEIICNKSVFWEIKTLVTSFQGVINSVKSLFYSDLYSINISLPGSVLCNSSNFQEKLNKFKILSFEYFFDHYRTISGNPLIPFSKEYNLIRNLRKTNSLHINLRSMREITDSFLYQYGIYR